LSSHLLNSLRELLLVFAFVETLENVTVHCFGIALRSRPNTGVVVARLP
jgi:hypothetical protein